MKHDLHPHNERIKEMLEANMLHKQIAYELGVNPYVLRGHLNRYFIIQNKITATYKEKKLPSNEILRINEANIMELHDKGVPIPEIARKFGIGYNKTWHFINYRKRRDNEHSQA